MAVENNNEALIDAFYKEMEEELNKEPSQMDTDKIHALNIMIARLEGNSKLPDSLNKDIFFIEFDQKYGFDLKDEQRTKSKSKKRTLELKKKIIAAGIVVCFFLGTGNVISSVAVGKSLWQIFEEKTHSFRYYVNDSADDDELQNAVDGYEEYSSWEELVNGVSFPLLNLEYLPEGVNLQLAEKTELEGIERVQALFTDGDTYFNFVCEYIDATGAGVMNKNADFEIKQLGDKKVYISDGETKSASFVNEDVLYVIDTNSDINELEKIIQNMK